MHTPASVTFPVTCDTVGKKVDYVSRVLLPSKRFDEYVQLMGEVLDENVHYIDPVHELRHRADVLTMFAKYVPRTANDKFEFELIDDGPEKVIWRWTIALKIRFTPFEFTIHGLVHARVSQGRITYQREYYDPMESIGVIPLFGRLYKLMLKLG
jgi:hypothetical protein